MKWTREEYVELMTFGKVERQMFVELVGTLVGLDEEWRKQGASEDEINMIGFDWDYVPVFSCGAKTGLIHGQKPRIIEDTPEYTVSKDALGRTVKLTKGYATIPLPLDFPVKTMDDWLKIKHSFQFHEDRIDWNIVEQAKKLQSQGTLILGSMEGGFDLPRELMEDILTTVGDMTLQVLDLVSDHVQIDNLFVHEDMAGKSGPLVGPSIIEEFIKPYYRKIWDMLSSKGTKLFSQDSDGNMLPVIDAFLDCGVNIMYPAEPAAGMDIVELRKKYGK